MERVIAQIRFPTILAICKRERVADFHESVRGTYPYLQEETHSDSTIWRFADSDLNPKWRISLCTDFLSLDTAVYGGQDEFLDRLEPVVAGVQDVFSPHETKRIGLRYIDRLKGEALDRISELIRPEILGILQPASSPFAKLAESTLHAATEARFQAEEGFIRCWWGKLPAHAAYDPLEPVNSPSWLLDLDMSATNLKTFDTQGLIGIAKGFSEQIYSLFRIVVTDEFLKFYGGNP